MFKVFTSFADFEGCDDGQRLWCFDCFTDQRQNRTWCVSDLDEDETKCMAMEYANEKYGDDLRHLNFFDPCYPDFLGNFAQWYRDEKNRRTLRLACEIEGGITDDDPKRQAKRDMAMSLLRNSGLDAHLGEIEDVVMWDVIRDEIRA